MAKNKGLGRGLDALLAPIKKSVSIDESTEKDGDLRHLAISHLKAGKYQPRTQFDEDSLNELADSIRAQGLMQPLVVRRINGNNLQYEIIAGERRYRAAQRAGLSSVPVLIREVDDQSTLALALIENIQRKDLNALDEARALKRLLTEFSLSHEEVAKAVGKSRSSVSNLIRLTELAEPVQEKLLKGNIDMGHARALASLSPAQQILLSEKIVAQKLNVRATEILVSTIETKKPSSSTKSVTKNRDLANLEEELSERIGAYVLIKPGRDGAGELVIRYANLEQLDGILMAIKPS